MSGFFATTPGSSSDDSLAGIAAPLLAAFVVMFAFLTCPLAVTEMNADASLNAVLHHASAQGLQFGTELVSTYGPLGFLIFPHYSDHAASLRMIVDVLVGLTVALGLCVVAWRMHVLLRCLLLGVFVWTAANVGLRTDLVLHSGLFFWGLLSFVQSGRRLLGSALVFSVLGAFCGLAKVSLLFLSAAGLGLLALHLVLRGRPRLAAAAIAMFTGTFLCGWVAAGQHLGNLGSFLANALLVARSYNAALGVEGLQSIIPVGAAVAVLALAVLLLRWFSALEPGRKDLRWRRVLLFGWGFLFAVTSWKHSVVRGDQYHAGFFPGFALVLMLALEIVPGERSRARFWGRCLTLPGAVLSLFALQIFVFPPLPGSLAEPYALFRSNLRRVFNPGEYARVAGEVIEGKKGECQLPRTRQIIGRATVDVFGQDQAYALYNRLDYRPRPVFQSYAACDSRLNRLNEKFFLSPAAPDFWLYQLDPLDRKFAPLEDAWLLRDLLINCEPVASEKDFLLLKRISAEAPRLKLLQEGSVAPGQPIDLRQWGETPVWLELGLEPNLAGHLRQLVYRPPTIRLAAWREPGQGLIYRHQAAAPMLAAGFLASPLLIRTADVQNLYSGNSPVRPGAYSVDLGEGDSYWQGAVRFRVYRIENRFRQVDPGTARTSGAQTGPLMEGQPDANGKAEVIPATPQPAGDLRSPSRPFSVFGRQRWRPTLEPPGSASDVLAYGVFLVLPVASAAGLILFARRSKSRPRPAPWPRLIAGNLLIMLFLLSFSLLIGETWFRFFYDATDSLAYTRVTEQWVRRHWKVNSAGCRDSIDYAPGLEAGRRRLSFIGDSFTAGHGIKDVEDRLANRLRRAQPDWQVHVLANIGLDTGGELALVKRLVAQGYQMDRVVLVYCLNDIGDLAPEQIEAYDAVLAKVNQEGWLIRNSYLLNLLYERYQVWRHPYARNYSAYVSGMYAGPLWSRQKERLKAFRDAVESNGGSLSVITYPLLHALGPDYPYASTHQQLSRFWQELKVPHLDLLPVFENLPANKLVVNPYDAHPNEYANELAARAVREFLFEAEKQ